MLKEVFSVGVAGFEPTTSSSRTSVSRRLSPQAVLVVRETCRPQGWFCWQPKAATSSAAYRLRTGCVLLATALTRAVQASTSRLNALLARARGDDVTHRDLASRYREMAESLGYEGHIAWAKAMIEGAE